MQSDKQLENLKKGKATQFTSGETAAKAGRAGAIKSNEVQRKKKAAKQAFLEVLATVPKLNPMNDSDKQLIRLMRDRYGIEDLSEVDIQMFSALAIAAKAMKGDARSMAFMLETAGEDAAARVQKDKIKLEREKLKLERERLELERERIEMQRELLALKTGHGDEDDYNKQTLAIADLILNPVPNRAPPAIDRGVEGGESE